MALGGFRAPFGRELLFTFAVEPLSHCAVTGQMWGSCFQCACPQMLQTVGDEAVLPML